MYLLLQGVNRRWNIHVITCEDNRFPPPFDLEGYAWYGVQRISKMENSTLESEWLPDDCRSMPMAVLQ
jgi:hypothetical protein